MQRARLCATRTCSTSIQQTGKATYRAEHDSEAGVELEFCPSSSGFKSLRAMAYHPDTQAFYIPLNLSCEKGRSRDVPRVEGGGGSGGGRRTNLMHPESPTASASCSR